MAREARVAVSAAGQVNDLLPLALSRPREALARARMLLASAPGPADASVAHQAASIALRDLGDTEAAVAQARAALRQARRSGDAEREADVLASLGIALVYAGRTAPGLAAFEQAVQRAGGVAAARVLARRGVVLRTLGRYPAALADLRQAVTVLRRSGDQLWTARALINRGLVNLDLGSTSRADADFVAAARLFSGLGQELEAAYAVHNRAGAAFTAGDLPAALAFLDAATASFRALNVPTTPVRLDRCEVLLAAGLAADALTEATAALADLEKMPGWFSKRAEVLLMAANCALAAGQPRQAEDWAQAAYQLFRSQHSPWRQARAQRVLAEARYRAAPASPAMLTQSIRAASRLDSLNAADAAQAHLLAGRIALDLGRAVPAEIHLAAVARTRHRGPALARVSGWLGEALRAEAAGQPGRMLTACRRGLAVLDEHRLTLGASELRAQATVHGAELASLAQRHAVQARRPRQLLIWSERWRATALAVPPVRPSADPELNASLAALRSVTRQLAETRSQGQPTTALARDQQRLEGEVRARTLQARGAQPGTRAEFSPAEFSPADLLDELGPARLVQIADVDGRLHVLVCGAGQVRQFAAGHLSEAVRGADFARFALRRLARTRPGGGAAGPASARSILDQAAPRLEQALLGSAVRHLGDGPVVIVPPGTLHSIPWTLLPSLTGRAVSVAPSASAWLRARRRPRPRHRRVTLARGPGLASDGAEVPLIAPLYDDVTTLEASAATADKVLSALDGAWLAHIAAHGIFRADSPLFSSLRLHDGPLTVYDFERLNRAPYRLVLSSCDSGVTAPAGHNELLGLVSSLLPLGTAGIMAAIVPLNDQAVIPLMVDLHQHLKAGLTLAEAACQVRRDLPDDPVLQATAASLLTLGAA